MERLRLEKESAADTPLPDMNLPAKTRDVLQRYSLALMLAGLAIFVRWILPVPVGASVYQLPIAAVAPERLVWRTRTRPARIGRLRNR